jgi:hypothetical protein
MTRKDKRETPRIQPFVASCHVVDGARRFAAYVTDLSVKGVRVTCEASPPRPEAWIVLEVRLGRTGGRVRLQGQVRWVGSGRTGNAHQFGITFQGLDATGQAAVADVVEEFRRRAAEL